MKITVKCKLVYDTKMKADALSQMVDQYANVANAYFKVLTKRHLGWSKRKLMVLLEQRKDLLKWFPSFPSALRQSARDKAIEAYKSWAKTRGRKPRMLPSVRLDVRTYRIIKTDNKKYPFFASITTREGRMEFPLGIGGRKVEVL